MYAVFDRENKFISFVEKIPTVSNKTYFLYKVEDKLQVELYSAFLEGEHVIVYCNGDKVLNKLRGKGLFRRICNAITKYRRPL